MFLQKAGASELLEVITMDLTIYFQAIKGNIFILNNFIPFFSK